MPDVVSEALDRIEGFLADLERARAGDDAVAEAKRLVDRAAGKAADAQQAQHALASGAAAGEQGDRRSRRCHGAMLALPSATEAAVEAASPTRRATCSRTSRRPDMEHGPAAPAAHPQPARALAKVLRSVLDAADLVADIFRFVNGFEPSSVQAQFRFEWRPGIKSWPSAAHPLGIDEPILIVKAEARGQHDNLVLAVDGRASGKGEMRVDVLAELRDFTLLLLPGESLVRFDFDHLSFHAGSTGKAEVDVVLNDIEFLGLLGFVETLKELIPFDGFSDPPFLDVSPKGSPPASRSRCRTSPSASSPCRTSRSAPTSQVPFLGKVGHRRLQLLHPRAAVHPAGHVPRRRRLVPHPPLARRPRRARARARGGRHPRRSTSAWRPARSRR